MRAWWATLAAGLVVAGVVWLLLERLRRSVLLVEERVEALWTQGKRVAQNTQAAQLLGTTTTRGAELAAELAGPEPSPEGGTR